MSLSKIQPPSHFPTFHMLSLTHPQHINKCQFFQFLSLVLDIQLNSVPASFICGMTPSIINHDLNQKLHEISLPNPKNTSYLTSQIKSKITF